MSSYLEQSATTFLDMQQQLQKQARSIFGSFPFGFPGGPQDKDGEPTPGDEFKQPQKKTGS